MGFPFLGSRGHIGKIYCIMTANDSSTSMFYGSQPIIFEYAKKLRSCPTKAESVLWERLKCNSLGVKFRRQHPIASYIADFYCHKFKLVIELDGGYHHNPEQKEYDINRTIDLNYLGIKVLRFKNEEVLTNIDQVINRIKQHILS